jgi:PDDEXK-like domain of unknown function (DUF3799)
MVLSQSRVSNEPINNIISIREKKVFHPGMYDISNDEYHNSYGISRSGLMLFKRSPLHYADRYIKGNQKKDTKSIYLGKAVHKYVLEPDKFTDEYFLAEKVDGRTAEGKKRKQQILLEAKGKEIIQQDDFDLIESISNAILNHDTASLFLKGAQVEKSIFWRDCTTNVMVKCRPDILLQNVIADIKTTDDASLREFTKDVFKYGYHIQAAMMQDGIYHIIGKKIKTFVFIAIEKSSPYAVAIYDINKDIIEAGQNEYKELLKQFSEHEETQNWSGYKTTTICLPSYYNN